MLSSTAAPSAVTAAAASSPPGSQLLSVSSLQLQLAVPTITISSPAAVPAALAAQTAYSGLTAAAATPADFLPPQAALAAQGRPGPLIQSPEYQSSLRTRRPASLAFAFRDQMAGNGLGAAASAPAADLPPPQPAHSALAPVAPEGSNASEAVAAAPGAAPAAVPTAFQPPSQADTAIGAKRTFQAISAAPEKRMPSPGAARQDISMAKSTAAGLSGLISRSMIFSRPSAAGPSASGTSREEEDKHQQGFREREESHQQWLRQRIEKYKQTFRMAESTQQQDWREAELKRHRLRMAEANQQQRLREAAALRQHKLNMLDCFVNCNFSFCAAGSILWKRLWRGLDPFVTLPGVPLTLRFRCLSFCFSDNISD